MKIRSSHDLYQTGSCRLKPGLRDQLLKHPDTRVAAKIVIHGDEIRRKK